MRQDLTMTSLRFIILLAVASATAEELPPPLTPEGALKTFQTKPDLRIELIAAEPLVQSPVAIDWDAKGRLWVVEMFDYPMGIDGNWKAGGRVKVLEDTDDDGRYDCATIFL